MGSFFQDLTHDIKVTVAENSQRHSITPTYIHKVNLGVNMSYNMRHALNTMFCLLSVSRLVGELFCLHTTVMLTVCYINRQPGRGYHYSDTNACGESAASKKLSNSLNVIISIHFLEQALSIFWSWQFNILE